MWYILINISFITLLYNPKEEIIIKRFNNLINNIGYDETIFILNKYTSSETIIFDSTNLELCYRYDIPLCFKSLSKTHNIKFLIPKNNRNGWARPRNEGVKHAKFNNLAFLDEDVIPDKNWIFIVKNFFKNNDGDMIFGSDSKQVSSNFGGWWRNEFDLLADRNVIKKKQIISSNHFIICAGRNMAILKSAFNSVNGYNLRFNYFMGEDPDLEIRLLLNKKRIIFDPKLISEHHHNISFVNLIKSFFLSGKSDANWYKLYSTGELVKYRYLFFNFINHILTFILILLFLINIYYFLIYLILFFVYFYLSLSLNYRKIRFIFFSFGLFPIKMIISTVGFYYELFRFKK